MAFHNRNNNWNNNRNNNWNNNRNNNWNNNNRNNWNRNNNFNSNRNDNDYFDDENREKCLWADGIIDEFVFIEFGNSRGKKILNPQTSTEFDLSLDSLWKTERDGFPGSLAVSLLQQDMGLLKQQKYHILAKSDGTRYILFAFDTGGKQVVDMIERSGSHCEIILTFHASVFQGTAFDGELVKKNNGKYEFQVFDCMVVNGKVITNENYSTRLKAAMYTIRDKYKYKDSDPFEIIVKKPIQWDDALSILKEKLHFEIPIDGLILVSEKNPYVCGRDNTLFKYKKKEGHTVDFKIKIAKDQMGRITLNYHVIDGGKLVCVDIATPNPEDLMKLGISSWNLIENQVVECRYDDVAMCWKPIKIRFDKDIPNNLLTLDLTRKNLEENILPETICFCLRDSAQ